MKRRKMHDKKTEGRAVRRAPAAPHEEEEALRGRVRAQDRQIRSLQDKLVHLDYLFAAHVGLNMAMRDFAEQKQAVIVRQSALRHDLNNAAALLLASDIDKFEESLLYLMSILGKGLDVDRVFLFRNSTDADGKLHCRQIYEWATKDAAQQGEKFVEDIIYEETLPGWEDHLSGGRTVNTPIGNLSQAVRDHMSPQGIRSVLVVPILLKGKFWGFIGLADCRTERVFSEDDETILRSGSLMVGNSFLHNEIMQGLIAAREVADTASQAKSHFLASMSHEIRTPMNAVLGMTDLMRTDNLDETQRDYLSGIKKMSRALLNIINDILDFSKIESGKMELVQVNYDLYALYDNVCSVAQFLASDKALQFESSIDERLPRALFGDEGRVRQIIINLVTNAVKYTQKGRVSLHFRKTAANGREYFTVEVPDTGVGIRREDFPRLFTAFEQLDKNKNKGIAGTGLGLSITKRLTDLMDGEIFFESEYGKGSVFTVRLPLAEGDFRKTEFAHRQKRCSVSPDAGILVVDDNAANLTVALGFLDRHGVRADSAAGGAEAIEMVRARRYDLVFMDHMMPGMDGIEAVQRIRAIPGAYYARIPIVALSANVVSSARESFFKAGMNDFISKPIAAEELNAALIKWLPPEKILGDAAERTDERAADGAFDDKLRPLEKIGDLDIALGLSRVDGNKSIYIDILRRFCKGLDGDIADIRAFMENAEWKNYSVRLHSIKSVFANFGNRRMTDRALALESASLSGDVETCLKGTAGFCDEMANFRAKLLDAGLMESEESFSKKFTDADTLTLKLNLLERACFEFNTDEANTTADELRQASCGVPGADALLTEICDLVDSLDYNGVAGKCEALIRTLAR
ncbi:MAG: response regulator [Desulfovibrio sp.]|jgi:signal transduction histidine kinase/FixJ family two-component response regulator/HPt (histidine-containing phosphotransfer) domain-containing protein|nr:response regulator [Desulfovibrio sp.]